MAEALRTSIITDPPDGRIPALTPAAAETKRQRSRRHQERREPRRSRAPGSVPDILEHGPPLLPYSYNSNYQIVQTDDAVLVHAR